MEKRRLGRTGQMSTIVTFGTAALGTTSQDTVDKSVELILKHEVNHIDIAPGYGQAMERMKPWMPKIRDQMFLGCKTQARTTQRPGKISRMVWNDWVQKDMTCFSYML